MLYGKFATWDQLHRWAMPRFAPESLSERARRNLADAEHALRYVRGEMPFPNNADDLPPALQEAPYFGGAGGQDGGMAAYQGMSRSVGGACAERGITMDSSYGDYALVTGRVTLGLGVGNCGEMTAIAYKWLSENGHLGSVAFVECDYRLQGGARNNHLFLTLDRAQGEVGDPNTYGADCVVCDPWLDAAAAAPVYFAMMARLSRGVEVFEPAREFDPRSKLSAVYA